MRDSRLTRRSPRHALLGVLTLAVSAMLTAGLSSLAAAQPTGWPDLYNPWPPYLARAYQDHVPGNELVKPIPQRLMKQITEVVLKMADGALSHVDTLIDESKQIRNTHMLEEHAVFPRRLPYETSSLVVSFLNNAAGDAGKGISSISLVHAEMLKRRARVREIAQRYENPIKIPSDADALQVFLKQQTEEAKAIYLVVDWSMRGREYIAMWVLASLAFPDEALEKYQTRINEVLYTKLEEKLKDDEIIDSLDIDESIKYWRTIFMDLAKPYAAEEKRLIDHHVSRFMKLARYTKIMQDEITDQVVDFVDKTPPEWGEVPFSNDLFNPIRWTNDVLYPPDELDGFEGRGLVMLHAYFYVPDDIETPYGTATLGYNDLLSLDWKVLFRPPNAPAIEPKEMTLVRYPVRTHYFPAFVSGVVVSRPEHDFHGASWKDTLPVDIANKYGKEHRLLMIYGEQLLGNSAQPPTIKSRNPKISYELLQVGPSDWNDRFDTEWGNTWDRSWDRLTDRMKPQDERSIRGLDKVLVMATIDEGVIAGLKEFKINGLAGEWYLRKGNVSASIRFLRQAVTGSSPEMQGAESEPLDYIFAQDRVILEVALSHDVDLGEVPVVLGINGSPLDREFPAIWVPGRPGVYRTEPIRFLSVGSGQKVKRPGVTDLRVEETATVIALIPRTAPVIMRFPAISQFMTSPDKIGQHWMSAVRQAAVIAKKLDIFDQDPKAVLNEPAGQVPFRHIPFSNKVDITVGDLAAMILLRQAFIASMEGIVAELQKIDRDIGDDKFLLRMFYLSLRPHIADPKSPFRQIKVNPPVDSAWSGLRDISFAKAYDEEFLRRNYRGVSDRRGWILKATRQALDRYLEAAEFALQEAKDTDPAELEDLLDLVSLGFDKVAQRALPNLVKLTGTQSTGLRWEPDLVARAFVAGVHGRGLQYRANQDLADAEINIVIAAASVAMFVPVGIPLQAVAVVASAGMVAETFLHMIPEAIRRNDGAKFALGAVSILGIDRLNYAESKVIPEGMLVIAVLGSLVGLGGDFMILAQTVKLHRAAVAVAHAMPDVERSGLSAFMRLNTKEQAELAARMHDARLASVARPGRMTAAETRALKVYRRLRDEMAGLQRVAFRRGALGGALRKVKVYRTAAKQSFLDGGPPELKVGSSWFGLIIGKELGVGSYARVYALPDYPGRVLKVYRPGKEGIGAIERAEYVAGLLKERGIPQLEILGSTTKSEFPCLIQKRLAPEMKTYTVKFEAIDVAKSDGTVLHGGYAGLKEFSRYNEITGEQTLRSLPRPMQRAYLKLITDLSEAKDGARGLIWEDAHLENVYFRQTGMHKWEAGILDQDRIMPFGADLPQTHPMYQVKTDLMDTIPVMPYSGNMKIFSLVDQVKRPYEVQTMVIQQNGHIWPDARFFMEKMLENKNFLIFDPSTKIWSSRILDMDIVEDFFPAIREHVAYDFTVHMPAK